eukprot:TRINITY_DN94223_c0_g1_i1.p1 TRINITY_DN94223_c0_g1~~TRINITY_DN94223_c0_g1_i1.p1  ORF type:complete len:261 (-),score=7.27 TRINITY_DN94223_c0_g1_i1:63-845(-)
MMDNRPSFLCLPLDAVEIIAMFVGHHSQQKDESWLALTCTFLAQHLRLWCISIRNVVPDKVAVFSECVRVLHIDKPKSPIAEWGPQLRAHSFKKLRSLDLVLTHKRLADSGAEVLRASLPCHLFTLNLGLRDTSFRDAGAVALVSCLKNMPRLTDLTLSLEENHVTDSGAVEFASLRSLPALTALRISLWRNKCGNATTQALKQLKEAPLLYSLSVNLAFNLNISKVSAQDMATHFQQDPVTCRTQLALPHLGTIKAIPK